jgi:hypothetical protein
MEKTYYEIKDDCIIYYNFNTFKYEPIDKEKKRRLIKKDPDK